MNKSITNIPVGTTLNLMHSCMRVFSLISCIGILNQLCTSHVGNAIWSCNFRYTAKTSKAKVFADCLQNAGPSQRKVVLLCITAAIRKRVSYVRLRKRTKSGNKINLKYSWHIEDLKAISAHAYVIHSFPD